MTHQCGASGAEPGHLLLTLKIELGRCQWRLRRCARFLRRAS